MPPKSKLTPEQIRQIRASTKPLKVIAYDFKISTTYAFDLRKGNRQPLLAEK